MQAHKYIEANGEYLKFVDRFKAHLFFHEVKLCKEIFKYILLCPFFYRKFHLTYHQQSHFWVMLSALENHPSSFCWQRMKRWANFRIILLDNCGATNFSSSHEDDDYKNIRKLCFFFSMDLYSASQWLAKRSPTWLGQIQRLFSSTVGMKIWTRKKFMASWPRPSSAKEWLMMFQTVFVPWSVLESGLIEMMFHFALFNCIILF